MVDHAANVAEIHVPSGVLLIGPPFSLGPPAMDVPFGMPGRWPGDPFWVARSIEQDPLAVWQLRGIWDRLYLNLPAFQLSDAALAAMVGQAVGQGQLAARFVPNARICTCTLTVRQNKFNDLLPIIPGDSVVRDGKLLFQVTFDALVVDRFGNPAVGRMLAIASGNANDIVTVAQPTDVNGKTTVVLKTREQGRVSVTATSLDTTVVMAAPLTIGPAWFESEFQITGYNVCDEADFSGTLVPGNGLAENHREDFLFGARGVPMQGTGRGSNGRLIHLSRMGGGWHRNAHGHVDHVNDQSQVTFSYVAAVQGAFAPLQENLSTAVDPTIIPRHARFEITDVGPRRADDRGSAIQGHHIDNFLGTGNAVVQQWLARQITNKTVKFTGYR